MSTNVEDVAVAVRDSFNGIDALRVLTSRDLGMGPRGARPRSQADEELPLRTRRWLQNGGERALGPDFLPRSPLPPKCKTETEGYYDMHDRPVHRVAALVLDAQTTTRQNATPTGRKRPAPASSAP